jgi:hypothetical protein
MGFGSAPLGSTPAGFDAATTTEQRVAVKIAAYKVDGLTRDYVRDSAGRYVGEHPVDAKVFHRLRILTGTIRSAPGTGQGVGSLKWIDPATIQAFVSDQVNLTLQDMVEAGDIQIRAITVDTAVRGRVLFQVDYVNLRTGRPDSFRSVP